MLNPKLIMKTKIVLFLIAFTLQLNAQMQAEWASNIGGGDYDVGHTIRVDSNGNVYVAGQFRSTVSFDPNSNNFDFTAGTFGDAFLQKYDADGNFLWAKIFASDYGSERPLLEVDQNNDVYISAQFKGTIDLDPGPGEDLRTFDTGFNNVYLVKLNSDGDYVWGKSFEQITSNQSIDSNELKVDSKGNILLAGEYQGVMDFNFDESQEFLIDPDGVDGYLLKVDNNGNFIWAKIFEGSFNGLYINTIGFDSEDNIIAAGAFRGNNNTDFDPGPGVFNMSSPNVNNIDLFVLKLDEDGNFIWAKKATGSGEDDVSMIANDRVTSVAIDANDDIYITGYFRNAIDFDSSSPSFSLDSGTDGCHNCAGFNTSFYGKMNSDGDMLWVKQLGGGNYYGGLVSNVVYYHTGNVLQFNNNNLLIGFTFRGSLQYQVEGSSNFYAGNSSRRGVALFQLDPTNGDFLSDYIVDNFDANSYLNYMVLDGNKLYATGLFDNDLFLDATTSVVSNNDDGYYSQDAYVVKYTNATILSVDESTLNAKFNIFPNPASSSLTIKSTAIIDNIKIMDVNGKLLMELNDINDERTIINIESLSQGVYVLEIESDNSTIYKKILKN